MSHNLPVPASPPTPLSIAPNPVLSIAPNPAEAGGPPRLNYFSLLILGKMSQQTQRAYAQNLKRFFLEEYQSEPEPDTVLLFLAQDRAAMSMQLALYRGRISSEGGPAGTGLSSASVKLRLAAINALVDLGHDHRVCGHDSKGLVQSPTARGYRDTRGPGLDNVRRLLALPDRTALRGKRDYALLRLLCDNALRRAEVCALQVADFQPSERRAAVVGKGYSDKIFVTLHPKTIEAISEYLAVAGHEGGALFRNCAHRQSAKGAALLPDGLDNVVRTYGAKIGLKISPHKFRHFAITAALDQAGSDVRKVQKFSRHKKIETVITYDDNRSDIQGEITMLLGDLLDG